MIRLSFAQLQEITAGIDLSLPQKTENRSLTPAVDTQEETPAPARSGRDNSRLLRLLRHAVRQDDPAAKPKVSF